MTSGLVVALLMWATLAATCAQQPQETRLLSTDPNADAPVDVTVQQSDLEGDLQKRLVDLELKVDQLENRLARLAGAEWRLEELEKRLVAVHPTFALLDCDTGNFSYVAPSTGPLVAVACKNVEPYLEGYKVELQFTNLSSVGFYGMKATLRYAYAKSLFEPPEGRTVAVSTGDRLMPGERMSVTVTLNPVPAENIQALALSDLSFDGNLAR